jgi:hypothetical protein
MKGAISYALFGYQKPKPDNCFEFNSYVRGMMVNIRINRIIFPGWENIIHIDHASYESPYRPLFNWLEGKKLAKFVVCKDAPLCLAMLWRLKPLFEKDGKDKWTYTHVICRDIDSVCTYRDAQAVAQWIQEDKTIHCITDSISHNIPMMGGMIGFRPHYITERLKADSWLVLTNMGSFDWNRKGTDQDFLNKFIYPKNSDSATEHFVKGMRHNLKEEDGRHYSIPDIDIGIDPLYKELDLVCGHIGSAGYYEIQMVKFLCEVDPYRNEYKEIEQKFPTLFYWRG